MTALIVGLVVLAGSGTGAVYGAVRRDDDLVVVWVGMLALALLHVLHVCAR